MPFVVIPKMRTKYQKLENLEGGYIRSATLGLLAQEIEQRKIDGDTAELGVFRGDFAVSIERMFPERTLHLFDLLEGTIKEYYPLEKGSEILVISGKHVGEIGKITAVTPGTIQKYELIQAKTKNFEFETIEKNVIVIN
jgi:ribosomal protein S4E